MDGLFSSNRHDSALGRFHVFVIVSILKRISINEIGSFQLVERFFSYLALISCSFSLSVPNTLATIVINELLAATDSTDSYGASLEWIELYNLGSETISLSGYSLSDDPLAPRKWMLGNATIEPFSFIRIWATGYDRTDPGDFHTNFRLNKNGEILTLYHADGAEADAIHYPIQQQDISYGRYPDGGDEWRYFSTPSPNLPNSDPGFIDFTPAPRISTPGGVYRGEILVELFFEKTDTITTEIRYTLDGSEPVEDSRLYQNPIEINQTGVLRFRAFRSGYMPSGIETHSYIIGKEVVLPILSMVMDPDDLFGATSGIYVNASQHGRAWERPASIELFDTQGNRAFQENAGARIHGGASRERSPKHSFRLYFRPEYGASRLHYRLFPDSKISRINQLVLRGGFNDTWSYDREMQRETAILVSDQVVRNLQLDMGHLSCHGIFVELYLNGKYWGIYNPSERVEDDMLAEYFEEDEWTVVVDNELRDGDQSLWLSLQRWIIQTDFTANDTLSRTQQVIDLENFTDYIILNVWVQNYDWPRHNWYIARENSPTGRWRFFCWDVEYSFGSGINGYQVNQNTYNNAADQSQMPIGILFYKLTRNEEYRHYYWNRLQFHLNRTLSADHVHHRLNEQLRIVDPAIPGEAERWGIDKTYQDWLRAAQLAHDFIDQRTAIIIKLTQTFLGPAPVSVSDWTTYSPD